MLNKYPTAFKGMYDTILVYETNDHLWNAIKAIDAFTDIYHAHNEPNWFVSAIKEVSRKPVVLDWHDSFLLRNKRSMTNKYRIITEERNNAFLADGFNFPCVPMKNEIFNEFKALRNKPHIVLHSYLPKQFYRWDVFEWMGGICYEGRVDLPNIKDDKKYGFFAYCVYEDLAVELKKRKIPFYLYTVSDKLFDWYKKHDLIVGGGRYAFDEMIKVIGRHDWGLIGNIDSHREWENSMPNKVFEYIGAQMPVVALNAKHPGKWVEDEGVGINIKTLDELEEKWHLHEELRNNLTKKRLDYCMENHIHKLEGLYGNFV